MSTANITISLDTTDFHRLQHALANEVFRNERRTGSTNPRIAAEANHRVDRLEGIQQRLNDAWFPSTSRSRTPAAACNTCGGWTGSGGMSHHRASAVQVLGRTGCTCPWGEVTESQVRRVMQAV